MSCHHIRQENGLSALPITNSLTKVARAHIEALNLYHPDTETYGTGSCNRHSWSSHGTWTAVCYTGSAQSSQMRNMPREITESYDGNGYEIACWNSREITPRLPWTSGRVGMKFFAPNAFEGVIAAEFTIA